MSAEPVKSRIEAVTVYREGARVCRAVDLAAGAGGAYPAYVRVTGLPLAMLDSSVRVRVEGVPGQEIGSLPTAVDARVALDVPDADSDLAPPDDEELKAAHKAYNRLTGLIEQVERELSRLQRLSVVPRPKGKSGDESGMPPESPTAARLSLMEVREEREEALRQELSRLKREHAEAERTVRKLDDRLARSTTARQAREHELRKALVIALAPPLLTAPADTRGGVAGGRLIIEYNVPGARWAPAYVARLGTGGSATLAMRAVVAQQTGEDWSGVALTLSTADAQAWVELPELHSKRVGRRQTTLQRTGWRPPPAGTDELYRDYDREFSKQRAVPRLLDEEEITRETSRSRRETLRGGRGDDTMEDWEEAEDMTDTDLEVREQLPAMTASIKTQQMLPQAKRASLPPARMAAPPPAGPPPAMFAPPAPSPAFAPPPSAAPMRAETAKRSGAPLAAASSLMNRASAAMLGGGGGAPGGMPMEEAVVLFGSAMEGGALLPEPTAVTASRELLDYADLRMPAPRSADRGVLRRSSMAEVYLEYLAELRVTVAFDVMAVIRSASQRAQHIDISQLAGRYQIARSDTYDYAYAAETAVDIPSDGAFHAIPLGVHSAKVHVRHVVVPRESTDVFRLAELKNPLSAPILPGPVDVYMGKDFLLTASAPFTPPGGTITMGLGVDQAVKISRNTSYREETSGLMRGSLTLKHEIVIEIKNHRPVAIDCEVRERIPSVREGEDDIEITVEAASPPWKPYKPELASSPEAGLEGGYAWRVEVAGNGGTTELRAAYAIKIASKHELVGGNRREG